ncbi:MAG: hypothetical protein U0903_14445 [Planctomycetales bacterium]
MSRPISLCLLLALLIALRVSAPSDLMEGAQSKQVGYVMDVLLQRHWLLQYEINGEVATKPPLYNWCAAAICQICGTEAEWAMKLPSLPGRSRFAVLRLLAGGITLIRASLSMRSWRASPHIIFPSWPGSRGPTC